MLALRDCYRCSIHRFSCDVLGIPLFCSKDPHHHLKLLTELRGRFPESFLERSPSKNAHFDENNNVLEKIELSPNEVDIIAILSISLTNEIKYQVATLSQKKRDVQYEILKMNPHSTETEKEHIGELTQMILDCTEIDPEKRIRASSCLANKLFR